MPLSASRLLLPLLILFCIYQWSGAAVIHAKAWLAPKLISRAWGQTLAEKGTPVKPWPWADTWPVARLRVASLDIDQYILAGDSGNALAFSPGHTLASAELGSTGRAVISGHRDTHFSFLQHLSPGDQLSLETARGSHQHYRVLDASVVDSFTESLAVSSTANELLLVTCFPFEAISGGGPLRYVVVAKPYPVERSPLQSLLPVTGVSLIGDRPRFPLTAWWTNRGLSPIVH